MAEKKLVRSKSGLRIISLTNDNDSAFVKEEPQWVPDNEVLNCSACTGKFDFLRRRHHCRRCGLCFCGKCCDHMVSLQRMGFVDPVRHCEPCSKISNLEDEFFTKHIKVLMSGASFMRKSDSSLCVIYMSSDQRQLRLDGVGGESTTIDLSSVVSGNIQTDSTDAQGNVAVSGLTLRYRKSDDQIDCLDVRAAGEKTIPWIRAMHKCLKMLLGQPESPK